MDAMRGQCTYERLAEERGNNVDTTEVKRNEDKGERTPHNRTRRKTNWGYVSGFLSAYYFSTNLNIDGDAKRGSKGLRLRSLF